MKKDAQANMNGQQQAKKDIANNYADSLSRYRLRCAYALKNKNAFAASYMSEYNRNRNND